MKILFATSEAAPFCKTGGLGDVAGSLPQALTGKKVQVRGVLPLYECIHSQYRERMVKVCDFTIQLAWRNAYVGLFSLKENGTTWYFIDNEYYFKRPGLYGYTDDGERFAFFSLAVLESIRFMNRFSEDFVPDVIHANDWQTALIPAYLKLKFGEIEPLSKIKSVLTIHNIQYQGKAYKPFLEDVCGIPFSHYEAGTFRSDDDGCVNILKGGIELADAVTTVSPTYASELQHAYFAHGLESVLARNQGKVSGILNGIDTAYYSAEKNPVLQKNFTAETLSDKAENKRFLQEKLGLAADENKPLFAIISRLVEHKGLDLIRDMLDSLLAHSVQLVVLGQGEPAFEGLFLHKAHVHPDLVSANISFSPELALQIYAGCDFLLMPSKSEPCGLAQMIAMQFATVPIVRNTGGLSDTVSYYYDGAGNGFSFDNYDSNELLWTVEKALLVYRDKAEWAKLQENCMKCDFTWALSAEKYKKLYKNLI